MARRPRFYILVKGVPRPVGLMKWANWLETTLDRIIAVDTIERDDADPVKVSTIFLGLDHDFTFKGPPVLFESRVFGGPLDRTMHRYSTLAEARAGHQHLLAESVTEGELVAWQAQQLINAAKVGHPIEKG